MFVRPVRLVPLLLAVSALLVACGDDGADREDGSIAKAGKISVFDVAVGDCLNPGKELGTEITEIEAVPCKEPHTHEVFHLAEFEGEDLYPGEEKMQKFADAECLNAFTAYTGMEYLDSSMFFSYLQPSIKSWNEADDRRFVCVIVANGEPMTGSARKAGATTTTTAAPSEEEEDDEESRVERAGESKVEGAVEGQIEERTGLDSGTPGNILNR